MRLIVQLKSALDFPEGDEDGYGNENGEDADILPENSAANLSWDVPEEKRERKFEFEVYTCRLIGCELCSHWNHTDCVIREQLIYMGYFVKSGSGPNEMIFMCQACNRTSELLGWVKDVFQHCAPSWYGETLMRELDFVSRIFHGSKYQRGRNLFLKCGDLKKKLKSQKMDSKVACWAILMAFQELDLDSPKNSGNAESGRLIAPHVACNRIVEMVQEAIRKMELVVDKKMRMFKKACLAFEACDRELFDNARRTGELGMERLQQMSLIEAT
ncbi:OBERON-like protein [Cicer arietinum]|uniref:OBERON-like protein n=1 Tax=Cicer arietinum TaxID=3827 RepID=A0A1S2Y8B3_CICAR|nr:OBERON-like protein [Cicer arietinum]